MSLAKKLSREDLVKKVYDNGKRIICVLIILHLLKRIEHQLQLIDKNRNDYYFLFSMLLLRPTVDPPQCIDLSYVRTFIPGNGQKDVAELLLHFIRLVLPYNTLKRMEWVYLVPLVHFLKSKTKPFAAPALHSKDIEWLDKDIDLTSIIRKASSVSAKRYDYSITA